MRILHVVDSYLPTMGGIEMHVSDLAARQVAAGHEVRVLTATPRTLGIGDDGPVPVERLRWNPMLPGTSAFIEGLVAANQVDVVHAHLSIVSPLAWAALRGRLGTARVATMHSVLPHSAALAWAATLLSGRGRRDVQFTAVSEIAARPLRQSLGVRVAVLPNGIDPSQWQAQPTAAADSTFRVVSVGRLAGRKRPRALISMLAQIKAKMPAGRQFRATLIGAGPQLGAVTRDAHRVGLDDCLELPGALNRTQIRTVLAGSSVYLAPARLESFGIAALEARCAGLPVVAMACSGVGEFIADGIEGFLVDSDAHMVAATVRLAHDPDLVARLSRHNATTHPPMSWDRVVAMHFSLYQKAISAQAARRQGIRSVAV